MISNADFAWLQALADWFEAMAAIDGAVEFNDQAKCRKAAKTLRRIAEGEQSVDELERWYQEVGRGGDGP